MRSTEDHLLFFRTLIGGLQSRGIGLASLGLVVVGGISGLSLPALVNLVAECTAEEAQVTIKTTLALLRSQIAILANLIREVGFFVWLGGGHGRRGG
jgi:hypothetical protein